MFRLFFRCCNFSDFATERSSQANLLRLGFHEMILDAIDLVCFLVCDVQVVVF